MNLATLTAKQSNWTAVLFKFSSDGEEFSILAKRQPADIRTGRVQILIKAASGRAQLLTKLDEATSINDAESFVRDECLSI